jgi:putative peptidoglycan lipid II flippase
VKAALIAVAVNVALKIVLMGSLAQIGLALATSIGAWVNFLLVLWFARRAGFFAPDPALLRAIGKLVIAGVALTLALWLAAAPVARFFASWPRLRDESTLAVLGVLGAVVYFGIVLALFGREWLALFRRRKRS